MSKFTTLKGIFPKDTIVRFASPTKGCPLTHKEIWVWSAMVWRFRGEAVSPTKLARWTQIDRTKTLPGILARLEQFGIVEKDGHKWIPLGKGIDRFFQHYTKPNGKSAVCWNWGIYKPKTSIIDGLVLAADTLEKGKTSARQLGKRFLVTHQTIKNVRSRLDKTIPPESTSQFDVMIELLF